MTTSASFRRTIALSGLVAAMLSPAVVCEVTTVIYDPNSPTKGIQEAIDAVKKEGGSVFIPAGRYVISRTIYLPGYARNKDMTIYGEGNATIIEAEEEFAVALADAAKKATRTVTVKDASRFKIDDGVFVIADGAQYTTTRVASIHGNALALSDNLVDDYAPAKNGKVIHSYALMRSAGPIRNFTLRGMKFVHSLKKNFQGVVTWMDGSTVILEGKNIHVANVEITDSTCDAVLLLGKGNFTVVNCRMTNCLQRGIHIGDDNVNINLAGNIIERVGNFGIYFCNGCQNVNVVQNIIAEIGYYETRDGLKKSTFEPTTDHRNNTVISGIGGLGGGGKKDKFDNISNNIIRRSRGSGIACIRWPGEVRPGENINIIGNNIYDIEKSGIYVYAAQAFNVGHNTISSSDTGISIVKSIYTSVRGNVLRDCKKGMEIYSDEADVPAEYNVVVNNSLFECMQGILKGQFSVKNTIGDNQVIMRTHGATRGQ